MTAQPNKATLLETLQSHFGHEEFREGQLETIERLVNGESTLSIFPTGAGKSLCYQLPAILSPDKTHIVISPLISLIRDQIQYLESINVSATTLNSSQTNEERETSIKTLEANETTLLFLAPESLLKKEYQAILKKLELGLITIDEAHCVSEWGNSFRPSYLLAASVIRKLKPQAILALTATATKEVARDIRSRFKIKTKDQIRNPLYRENLQFLITPCLAEQKNAELVKLLREAHNLPAIVYVMKQIDAEAVCAHLQTVGIKARAYHAGMNADARKAVQDAFIDNKLNIVVATIAFGMGVNKPNIRAVIHYHLPKSPEGWLQESGRAGRDGKPSQCHLLACGDDLIPLTNYIQGEEISHNAIERIIEALFSQGKEITISKYQLCQANDVILAQLDIILSYLITEGYLIQNEPSWRYYQVSRLRYTTHDYGRGKQNLVNAINEHWGKIDSTISEETFKISRSRLLNILDEMKAVGDVAVKTTGKLDHFTLKKEPGSTGEIVAALSENFTTHKSNAIKRLDAVISAATTRSCIPARLIKYFGENIEDNCSKCSSCLGEKRARKLPSSPIPSLQLDEVEKMKNVFEKHKKVLSTATRLTRFFCGIHSPAIRHNRLYTHEDFGSLAHIPYGEILNQAKTLISR